MIGFILLAVFIAYLTMCITMCIVEEKRMQRMRHEISPQDSVTDERYCKLMPGVPEEIALKVRDVMVEVSGWDRDEIHPDTRIVEFELW